MIQEEDNNGRPIGKTPHQKLCEDFLARMTSGEIHDMYDYFDLAFHESYEAGVFVPLASDKLTKIQKFKHNQIQDLEPLKPPIETLKEYIEDTVTPKIEDYQTLRYKIGGPRSQYYHACYVLTKVMLIGDTDKRKGAIFHGEGGSGKTRIARYQSGIFESHWKNETKGIYDDKISVDEAHKQLLVMNEASMHQLFSKKNLSSTKRLTEGLGASLENKYAQPFTGFLNVHTLITCNALPYPFVEPLSTKSGFSEEEFKLDRSAMEERIRPVKFAVKF